MKVWHIVQANRHLGYDSTRVVVSPGYVYEAVGSIAVCCNGLHACKNLKDALNIAVQLRIIDPTWVWQSQPPVNSGSAVRGPADGWICRVDLHGEVKTRYDKMAGRYREVLWMIPTNAFAREYRTSEAYRTFGSHIHAEIAQKARKKLIKDGGKLGKWAQGVT